MSEGRQITDAGRALGFMYAGNATFTVVSKVTGHRITFRVREPQNKYPNSAWPVRFVSYLYGPDNESSYKYVGHTAMAADGRTLGLKAKSGTPGKIFRAFEYVRGNLTRGRMPTDIEFWHEGKCCRCGRKLTVPSSIESGIGPECAKMSERMAA